MPKILDDARMLLHTAAKNFTVAHESPNPPPVYAELLERAAIDFAAVRARVPWGVM